MSDTRAAGEPGGAMADAWAPRFHESRELVELSYERLVDVLATVRYAAVLIAASRGRVRDQVTAMGRAADLLGLQAQSALLAGRDDLARQAIAGRAAALAQLSRTIEQQLRLHVAERRVTEAAKRLEADVEEFGASRHAVGDASTTPHDRAHMSRRGAGRDRPSHQATFTGAVSVVNSADRPVTGSTR